ncbi:tRNA nucleotidyltransferase [candidate division KSB1 bacterium]|nr:MAG: tRNA nucleotidyltransferase [candidate division KSB1 bacterium]
MSDFILNQPSKCLEILKKIGTIADEEGFEVYVVGGYVRDCFLKRRQKEAEQRDIDFTVVGDGIAFAKILRKRLHAKNLVTYEKFGTAMLVVNDGTCTDQKENSFKLEFVSARKESYREDSRKPEVRKTNLLSDLARRDFTINAIAMGLNKHNFGVIVDPYQGVQDIKKKIIRTPLDPELTFKDDPLRILRAIRFATGLHFNIDENTKTAIRNSCSRLKIVSHERITDELLKILSAQRPSIGFYLMDETGVLEFVFPEIAALKGVEQRDKYHHKDVFVHTLKVVDNVAKVSNKIQLRFAALVHDIAKPRTKAFKEGVGWTFHGHDEIGARMMEGIARRLRLSKEFKTYVQKLIRLHLRPIFLSSEDVTDSAIRRLAVQAGEDLDDLLILCRADITSGNPQRVKAHLANFDFVVRRLKEVEEKDKLRAFQSPVRGNEIMAICGLEPGPLVGKLKKAIEEAILDGLIPNEHDAALQYLYQVKDEVIANFKNQASKS